MYMLTAEYMVLDNLPGDSFEDIFKQSEWNYIVDIELNYVNFMNLWKSIILTVEWKCSGKTV